MIWSPGVDEVKNKDINVATVSPNKHGNSATMFNLSTSAQLGCLVNDWEVAYLLARRMYISLISSLNFHVYWDSLYLCGVLKLEARRLASGSIPPRPPASKKKYQTKSSFNPTSLKLKQEMNCNIKFSRNQFILEKLIPRSLLDSGSVLCRLRFFVLLMVPVLAEVLFFINFMG